MGAEEKASRVIDKEGKAAITKHFLLGFNGLSAEEKIKALENMKLLQQISKRIKKQKAAKVVGKRKLGVKR